MRSSPRNPCNMVREKGKGGPIVFAPKVAPQNRLSFFPTFHCHPGGEKKKGGGGRGEHFN